MSLSAPSRDGRVYIEVDGSWEFLSRLTNFTNADNEPDTTTPDDALDDTVGAGAPSVGTPSVGPVRFTLTEPDIAGPAALHVIDQHRANESVKAEIWLGEYKLVGEQTSGAAATTVAIDKSAGEITIAKKGAGNADIPATFGVSDVSPGPFWRRGQIVEQGTNAYHLGPWVSATKRKVSLLGSVASGIVTRATAAEKAADWSVSPAEDAFKVHTYRAILTGEGRVLQGADFTASATSIEMATGFQPDDYLTLSFGLKVGR